MVIHHGGAGTTHSAARAGVPSVVIPFAGDQFFWADRLARLGVAAKAVNGKRPQEAELVLSIAFAERQDVRDCATALASAMAAENGVQDAVMAIEKLMANSSKR